MAVHHINVNQVRAPFFRGGDRRTERGEVRRKNRRRDANALTGHLLTSREIGSPPAI